MVGTQLGSYRVVEQIGEGGMATVYKAYQASVDRFVALKVLPVQYASDPNFMGRFQQEARVIANLEHPNIIPVHDFGEQDGITYLVMRYLQAGSLKEILEVGPLALQDIVRVFSQICSGLDYAHRQGVIHRDIKPANVLVDADGNAFLTDFGIAKMLEGNISFTATGGTVGTPAYMAPEQSVGGEIDARADIYALGVTLYEMLTGRVPFQADTPVAVILKHLHDPLPMPTEFNPDIPPDVERVVLRAMAKEPEDRYESALDMADALEQAVASAETRESPYIGLAKRAEITAEIRSPAVLTAAMRKELTALPTAAPEKAPPTAVSHRDGFSKNTLIVTIGVVLVVFIIAVTALQFTDKDKEEDDHDLAARLHTETALAGVPTATFTATEAPTATWTATEAPTATLTATEAPGVAPASSPYYHPSGDFKIVPPAGWTREEMQSPDHNSAAWANDDLGAWLGAYTVHFDAAPTHEELVDYVTETFSQIPVYEIMTVGVREYEGDPLRLEFTGILANKNYIGRQWVGASENMVWFLHVRVPEGEWALLDQLESMVLHTMRAYPQSSAGESFPIEPGTSYTDPNGDFEIIPPAGWVLDTQEEDGVFSAVWTHWDPVVTLSVDISHPDAPLSHDEMVNYLAKNLKDLGEHTLIGRDYESEPIRLDLRTQRGGASHLMRQWAGTSGGVLWFVTLAAPEEYPAVLNELEQLVLPDFHVYGAGETLPIEVDTPYTHPSGDFTISPPVGWSREENRDPDANSVVWSYWDPNAALSVYTVHADFPLTYEDLVEYVQDEVEPGYREEADEYTIVERHYESEPLWLDVRLTRGDEAYLSRLWVGHTGSTIWHVFTLVPAGYASLIDDLEARILPTLEVHPGAATQQAAAFAVPILEEVSGQTPLYAEDFGDGTGWWLLEGDALHEESQVRLPPASAISCACWRLSDFVLQAAVQLNEIVDEAEPGFVLMTGPETRLVFDLTPDRPFIYLEREDEAVDAAPIDAALLEPESVLLTAVVVENQAAVFLGDEMAPVFASEEIGWERERLRFATGSVVAMLDDIRVWDLSPPSMSLDHEAVGALGARMRDILETAPAAVEESFEEMTDAWQVEGGQCEQPGMLGLCGGESTAVYRYQAVRDFALAVDVRVDWAHTADWATFDMRFGTQGGFGIFSITLNADGYPEASLSHYDREAEETVRLGDSESYFSPALLTPGQPFTLQVMAEAGAFVAYIDEVPLFHAEGVQTRNELIGFRAANTSIALDNFRLWPIGDPGMPQSVTAWTEAQPNRTALVFSIPQRPELTLDSPEDIDLFVPAWSPDGRQLVLEGMNEAEEIHRLWLAEVHCYTRPDCLGELRPLAHEQTTDAYMPDWSPSGEWIAFLDANVLAWVHPDGTEYQTLWEPEADWEYPTQPVWAPLLPDGTERLALIVEGYPTEGETPHRLRVLVFEVGGGAEVIYDEAMQESLYFENAAWTPEGDRLALSIYDQEKEINEYWLLPAEGADLEVVDTEALPGFWDWVSEHWPRWGAAPDAAEAEAPEAAPPSDPFYAWTCMISDEGERSTVCFQKQDASELMFDPLPGFNARGAVAWAPDGSEMALVGQEVGQMTMKLWLVEVHCYDRPDCLGEPRPLAHEQTSAFVALADWSPSGEWIAFTDDYALALVHPDGTDYQTLWAPEGTEYVARLAWAPSEVGARLAVVVEHMREDGTQYAQVLIFDVEDGSATLVYETEREERVYFHEVAWTPDGTELVLLIYDDTDGAERFWLMPAQAGVEEVETLEQDNVPEFWTWLAWQWPRWGTQP